MTLVPTIDYAFGAAIAVIIGAIFTGIVKIIAVWRGDGNKILEVQAAKERLKVDAEAAKYKLQHDEEVQEDKRMDPVWQRLLDRTSERVTILETKINEAVNKITDLSVELARAETKALILDERVKTLEAKLAEAEGKHGEDHKTIESLRARLKILEIELEDAHSQAIKLGIELRDYKRIYPSDPPSGTQPQ